MKAYLSERSVGTRTEAEVATTGNPVLFVLALADIGISGTDLYVQKYHDEIAATEKGKAFLEVWEKVYLWGNLITAGPALIGSVFKAGTLLLRAVETAKNFNVRNFVMACFTRIIIERNIANFAKNTVKEILYGEEALKNWGVAFSYAGITRLQEAGVVIIKALSADKKVIGYAAIYKGEVIASGTAKEVRNILKEVWGARGAELIVKLEDLLVRIRFKDIEEFRIFKNLPKFAEKIPSSGTVAKIEIEGKSFFGINSKLSPETLFLRKKWFNKISWVPPKKIMPLKINQAQSLLHAEGHALMNAFEEIGELPEKLTLFVDRATCNMCKGELPSLMRTMGIKELTIVHGESRVIMILNINL